LWGLDRGRRPFDRLRVNKLLPYDVEAPANAMAFSTGT
jgi:hypothetical protein